MFWRFQITCTAEKKKKRFGDILPFVSNWWGNVSTKVYGLLPLNDKVEKTNTRTTLNNCVCHCLTLCNSLLSTQSAPTACAAHKAVIKGRLQTCFFFPSPMPWILRTLYQRKVENYLWSESGSSLCGYRFFFSIHTSIVTQSVAELNITVSHFNSGCDWINTAFFFFIVFFNRRLEQSLFV